MSNVVSGRKKLDFPQGVKVRGYGLLNEYGEFDFIPEQTGARQGQLKIVKETGEYTITASKKKINVNIHMKKSNGLPLMKEFMSIVNNVLTDLQTYDF